MRFARESPFPPARADRASWSTPMAETTYIRAITATLAEAMRADERVLVLGEDVAEGGPVHRDRRAGRGVRHRARDQHADQRGGDHRGRDRRRAVGPAARARDHVRRLHHARARPARERGGEGALHVRRPADRAARAAHAGRRGPARRGAALAEPRELAHARAGAEGRDAEPRRRRGRPARRARSPTRTRSSSSRTRRSTSAGRTCPSGSSRCRSARRGHAPRRAATSPSSRSRASSHEALAAAERLAAEDGIEAEVIDPRTLVPLDLDDDRRVGRAHRPARRRARGRRARRLRRRDRGAGAGGGVRLPRRARRARRARRSRPIPFSAPLEDAYLPGADEIVAAVRGLR